MQDGEDQPEADAPARPSAPVALSLREPPALSDVDPSGVPYSITAKEASRFKWRSLLPRGHPGGTPALPSRREIELQARFAQYGFAIGTFGAILMIGGGATALGITAGLFGLASFAVLVRAVIIRRRMVGPDVKGALWRVFFDPWS